MAFKSLGELYFEGAREAAERVKKRILEKAANCPHERVELVEAHKSYQLGVCTECRTMFRREKQ